MSPLYARSLLDYLASIGRPPAALFGAERVAAIEQADARGRMPIADWVAMFDAAIAATGDPDLPLKVGEAIKPRHYGVLGYVAMSCATLGEAVERLQKYERLVGEISSSRLERRGDRARLLWRSPHADNPPPALSQSSLAGWVTYARWLLGREDLVCAASFQFPAPARRAEYERIFRSAPRFGAGHAGLEFPASHLELPIVQADAELRRLMDARAEAELRELQAEPAWLLRLREALARNLSGRVSLVEAARALAMSSRTLQRRLDEAGLGFQDVLDGVRRLHAERYLADPALSLTEIAFLLGYSEHSAFTRAFRRWTGRTPAQFRAQCVRYRDAIRCRPSR